jgi:DNA-binding NtrC family response regulator
MGLREFLIAHREQLQHACRSEPGASSELQHLKQCLLSVLADGAVEPEVLPLAAVDESPSGWVSRFGLVGSSVQLKRLRVTMDQLSRTSRASVLILGESGTGRHQCARSLHAATYPDGELFELTKVDQLEDLVRRVAALRVRPSGSAAAGLTVYVHELPETSPMVQFAVSKLIREQGLQLRVIASSRRVLEHASREGLVRSDLVGGFSKLLELPPLRDRVADIPDLVRHFAELTASCRNSRPTLFSQRALQRLQDYPWLGNLSELKKFIDRLSEQLGASFVELEDLPELGERAAERFFVPPSTGIDFVELERLVLMQALAMARNDQKRAASLLGVTPDQMLYRLLRSEVRGGGRHSD